MKYINSLLVCLLSFFVACTNGIDDGYIVTGTTSNTGKVYLNNTAGFKMIPIDSVEVANGEFVLKGNVENCEQYFLTFENQKGAFAFFLSNGKIDITVSEKHPYFSRVTKSAINMEYQIFTDKMNELSEKQNAERQKYYAAKEDDKRDSLLGILQDYGKKQTELAKSTFDKNIDKAYASSILAKFLKNSYTTEQLDSIINGMPIASKNNKVAKQLIGEIEAKRRSAEGQAFINILQKTPEGELVSLKDVVASNKCVLIDFWASWCGPCIASMPEFKELYKEYKDRGFEIYAVSIDNKKENWTKCIKDKDLPWIHVSELKGWDTQAKTDYAVNGVPTTVLINKDGIIVAKNRHGKELKDKIIECLR